MTLFTKTLLALTASVALTLGGASSAALADKPEWAGQGKSSASVTITFDANGTDLPVAEAATDWSKNTGISVVTGDCTGANCVEFQIATFPCGMGAPVGGCAYQVSDGSCTVEVGHWVTTRTGYLSLLVTKHEAGHCIFRFGGISQSLHIEDPRALMSAVHSSAPSKQEATLTSIDRKFTQGLF